MQVDIHSHIIPGVDDGSRDLETSIGLLKMAAENGTTDIIATPHVIDVSTMLTWDSIRHHVEELQKEADKRGIPIRIYPGAETELNWDLLELIREDHTRFCLAGSRYLLMEMPSLMLPPHLDEMIYELQLMDIVPVLAHPERQIQLMEQPGKLLDLLKKGCVAQSNGGSLTGVFGPKVHDNVHRLLDRDMVGFIGSDAHNLRHRNTNLKVAREKLENHWGHERAEELFSVRPRHILENKALPPDLYTDRLPSAFIQRESAKEEKNGFFAKFFGK